MSDSTITVSFQNPARDGSGMDRLVHVVVVKPDIPERSLDVVIYPVIILFIVSSVLVFFLLKIKPSDKLTTILDKIEKTTPRFLKF